MLHQIQKPACHGGLSCLLGAQGIEPARVQQPCGLLDEEGEARRDETRAEGADRDPPMLHQIQKPADHGGLSCFSNPRGSNSPAGCWMVQKPIVNARITPSTAMCAG